jgi:hypothetical protein
MLMSDNNDTKEFSRYYPSFAPNGENESKHQKGSSEEVDNWLQGDLN